MPCAAVCCRACCSVLQCVAVCSSVLQCVAVCCSVLKCVAVGSDPCPLSLVYVLGVVCVYVRFCVNFDGVYCVYSNGARVRECEYVCVCVCVCMCVLMCVCVF